MKKLFLKKDSYRKSRGGYSRGLQVYCEKCGTFVCVYQKDGPGPLKRLYADRILKPLVVWKNGKKLFCPKCKQWLGVGSIYSKERRKCFILFQDVVNKKTVRI